MHQTLQLLALPLARRLTTLVLAAGTALGLAAPAGAEVIQTALAQPLTTPDNPGGGDADGTGVWFNLLTGTAEQRGFWFPDTLYADGLFFLLRDTRFAQPAAQVYVQGFFSRGNGVIYDSPANPNPARFAAGDVIGPGVGWQAPGAGYPDLGPVYGNWGAGGRGLLGLTIRDPAGASAADVLYGFADIAVNDDFSLTLYGFAYETVRGQAITATWVPEPSAAWLLGLGLPLVAAGARRQRSPRR